MALEPTVKTRSGTSRSTAESAGLACAKQAQGKCKMRVGSSRDGGYVMLDDFKGIDAALSLGIGPDVSWDYAMAERGIPVWQYDHTIISLPQEHPLFHFEPKQIVAQNSSCESVTLNTVLRKLAGKQLVLKMDIDGDEWEVLAQLEPDLLSNCRQIVIELHHFLSIGNSAWRSQALQALNRLSRDFGVVHVHGNNLSKHIIVDNYSLPDSLEVTFANHRFYNLEPTDETFPGPRDRKNNLFFPDFHLGRFQFSPKEKVR
jgi:hypothetical protein